MTVEEIKSQIKIEEVIEDYVKIQEKRGDVWKSICPFHKEVIPSFNIRIDKQYFYCYGCKQGGDVIKFLELIEQISFKEAQEILLKRLGIDTSLTSLGLLSQVHDWFVYNINHPLVIKFLKHRKFYGYERELNFGYAPQDYDLISEFGDSNKEALEELGLITIRNKDTEKEFITPFFRNSLMIPIDRYIGTVGFVSRNLSNEGVKYKNSRESKFFKRRQLLLGYYQVNKEEIPFLVEGPLDWARGKVYNYPFLSGLGSQLSEDQISMLKNKYGGVKFLFDNDEGGTEGLIRAAKLCMVKNLPFDILVLPENEDPDTFLVDGGKLEDLETIEDLDFIKEVFEKDDIIKLLEKYGDVPDLVLDTFKIDKKHYKKENTSNGFLFNSFNITQLTKEDHLSLFLDIFPEYNDKLSPELKKEIDKSKSKNDIIYLLLNNNFYSKIKNPTKVFNELCNG